MKPDTPNSPSAARPARIGPGRGLASALALLTPQEARLLSVVLGLLLLGLTVRFFHLRAEHPAPVSADTPSPSTRSARP